MRYLTESSGSGRRIAFSTTESCICERCSKKALMLRADVSGSPHSAGHYMCQQQLDEGFFTVAS